MSVLAKMTCVEVRQTAPTDIYQHNEGSVPVSVGKENHFDVRLIPVAKNAEDRTPADEIFGSATPSGEVTMHICNADAARYFEPGVDYLIEFKAIM